MHPVTPQYIRPTSMPPDFRTPDVGDLGIGRMPGESVYTIQPLTTDGYRFVVTHHDAGVVDGDTLRVREIFPFMDEVLDEGLRVV